MQSLCSNFLDLNFSRFLIFVEPNLQSRLANEIREISDMLMENRKLTKSDVEDFSRDQTTRHRHVETFRELVIFPSNFPNTKY